VLAHAEQKDQGIFAAAVAAFEALRESGAGTFEGDLQNLEAKFSKKLTLHIRSD